MPYQAVLEGLLRAVPGASAALMLDAEGEVVVQVGERDERSRLIGAYQGIALATVRRTSDRYRNGPIEYMTCRYAWGTVVVRPLKDGYYMVVSIVSAGSAGAALHRSSLAQQRLNAEL